MKRSDIISLACLALLTLAVFFPALNYGYVDYDDPAYIVKNPYVNSGIDSQNLTWAFTLEQPKGSPGHPGVANLYHPLSWTSHMLDIEFFGVNNPQAQHIINLILHLSAAILCYFFILKLWADRWVAWLCACLFAIHPLHVESAVWLTARKDTLSGLFFFASLLCYVHLGNRHTKLLKVLSVSAFVLALLAKTSVVVIPALLILIDLSRKGSRSSSWWQECRLQCREKLPWIIPAAIFSLVAITLQSSGSHQFFIEQSSLWERIRDIPATLSYYLYRTANPTSLTFHYASPPFSSLLLLLLCLSCWIGLLVFCFKSRHRYPALWFGVLWFLICLAPVCGVFYVGSSFTADRYSYLALTGVFLAFGFILKSLKAPILRWGVALTSLACCAFLAHQQTKVWKNSKTLFTQAIEAQPRDARGYTNLGALYQIDQDYDEAQQLFEKALTLDPRNYTAHYNLGYAQLIRDNNYTAANQHFLTAIEYHPEHLPSLAKLVLLHRPNGPLQDLEKAWLYAHRYNKITNSTGAEMLAVEYHLLLAMGRTEEAEKLATRLEK